MKSAWAVLALLLVGCEWTRQPDLLAESTGTPAGPDCAACHFYPPPDANHVLHLGHPMADHGNGGISCRDCHASAIPGRATLVADSIFVFTDSLGRQVSWSGLSNPDFGFIRDWPLLRIDTLMQIRPIEQPGPTKTAGFLRQWMTGAAHLNGRIDVEIDSLNSDTARFGGRLAEFRPAEQSCSAVRCHSAMVDYRWAAPSKGLPGKGRYD